jgi:hypothetical protein
LCGDALGQWIINRRKAFALAKSFHKDK